MSGSSTGTSQSIPEVRCDFNSRITKRGHMMSPASIEDLAKAGFAPATAVGQRFLFNGGADRDESGAPADILCAGTVIHDPVLGFLLETDIDGYFWRSHDTRA